MEDFPSGQRGQTVNLLAVLSVVRIHHPPPTKKYADVAELADALDLGSSAFGVGVRLPSSAPLFDYNLCGNSSAVERNLAKVEVASSNLVSRSNLWVHSSAG